MVMKFVGYISQTLFIQDTTISPYEDSGPEAAIGVETSTM